MSVNAVVCVEKRIDHATWVRAEEKIDNPEAKFPYYLESLPPSLRENKISDRWDLRADDWMHDVDYQFTNGINYRGIPKDASVQTVEELDYWTDPDPMCGRTWLLLAELETVDWTEINQRHNVKIMKRGILEQLRSAGKPDEVRIVYGWNI